MRRLCCLLQERNGPKNESCCSGKMFNLKTGCGSKRQQIAKREADAAKQRTMFQGVREQLEAVNDKVCALRSLIADPTSPSGQPPEPPPLPAVKTTPQKTRFRSVNLYKEFACRSKIE